MVVLYHKNQVAPQLAGVKISQFVGRLFGDDFPFEVFMRQHHRHLGIGSLEILGVLRAGVDLGNDVAAVGENPREFQVFGLQSFHSPVEISQALLVADLCQASIITALI